MKTAQIIAVSAIFCIAGCASNKEDHKFTPPSAIAVRSSVSKVREHVNPEGKSAFVELEKALDDYQGRVEEQTKLLVSAQNDAEYWHQKQIKALRELWLWRSIALATVICVVGYIGIKTSWRFLR